ncbi:peptidoglycan DD-metalloendopeptidase family protein [Sphaerochaeta sp. PS]|uniref:peptidoglycan DD-metalloendopeptidase family protein n=1 Tax=Sphaerochaeta sp. PS TaxID=3076336 RepID=UPI0028A46764|nr:peptidoglycan DD-metalloendopeptidase family protein [Sphaerochaeta sp. PS]MDT4762931.1 peptidoglycan DD-metalloendopeptidase family protein [Sphaerochaeta sp. PS]
MIDRPQRRASKDGYHDRPSKGLIWTIALGIAICVVVIIVWYQFFPNSQPSPDQSALIVASDSAKRVEVVVDAPLVLPPTAINAPVVTAPVAENQARSLSEAKSLSQGSSKTIQYAKHLVAEGEDLNSIAAMYSLKTQTLISINQIRNIQAVKPGISLEIPDRDGQLYTVRDGDMLSTIARKYSPNMGWKTLQELNGLKSENIVVGQRLFIPDTSSSSLIQMADIAPIQFQKPATGSITALFGQPLANPATGTTESLNGILIVGSPGSAVVAAAAGNVVSAGYEVKGRGRFVELSHEGGYRTTYCHLENVEVKIGMTLAKGEVIGSIGTSGTSYEKPTLFFSIEQSGIALDPSQFF